MLETEAPSAVILRAVSKGSAGMLRGWRKSTIGAIFTAVRSFFVTLGTTNLGSGFCFFKVTPSAALSGNLNWDYATPWRPCERRRQRTRLHLGSEACEVYTYDCLTLFPCVSLLQRSSSLRQRSNFHHAALFSIPAFLNDPISRQRRIKRRIK